MGKQGIILEWPKRELSLATESHDQRGCASSLLVYRQTTLPTRKWIGTVGKIVGRKGSNEVARSERAKRVHSLYYYN
jgi:hypothetical protein